MSARLHTGHAYDWHQQRLNRIAEGLKQSGLATARIQGMKLRAQADPPRAAKGSFPYPARTCAQWRPIDAKIVT